MLILQQQPIRPTTKTMVIAGNFLTLNNVDKTFYIPQSISPKIMATYERKLAVLPVLCYAHNTATGGNDSWTAARLLRTITGD